jgi:murein DD-endopeptidase MepM/ murein hydrolase activator NlpD
MLKTDRSILRALTALNRFNHEPDPSAGPGARFSLRGRWRHWLTVLSVILSLLPSAFASLGDDSGFVVTESSDANGVALTVSSKYDADFTTTIDCTLENAKSSEKLPLTIDSAGRKIFRLISIAREDPSRAWSYKYKYHCKYGSRRGVAGVQHVYAPPFPASVHLTVLQGALGKFSHFTGSQDEYAVDWRAPEGTPICAARAGIVTGVRQDRTLGGTDPALRGKSNYIIIRQDDGTYAEYLHLQANGALVAIGDKVLEGQEIGRSGSTGLSSTPHIHFAAFQTVDGYTRITLPCRFKANGRIIEQLREGAAF